MKPKRGRTKNRGNKEEGFKPPILLLPDDILVDIVIRLPLKYRIQCIKVCKPWRRCLLLDPCRLSSPSATTLIVKSGKNISLVDLQPVAEGKDGVLNFKKRNDLNLEFVGSANGFICFFDLDTTRRYYLCNPITGKFIKGSLMDGIQKNKDGYLFKAIHGFGYDSKNKQHTVMHISDRKDRFRGNRGTCCRMYTFETSRWLVIKKSRPCVFVNEKSRFVPLNGAFYWIQDSLRRWDPITICKLDMATKEITWFKGPVAIGVVGDLALGVHSNCLCICRCFWAEIWVLRENACWSKEFVIERPSLPYGQWAWQCGYRELVMVLNDEEVLMTIENGYMVVYNIVKNTLVAEIRIPFINYNLQGFIHQVSFAPIPRVAY